MMVKLSQDEERLQLVHMYASHGYTYKHNSTSYQSNYTGCSINLEPYGKINYS
jgi:hypothetical protein